MKQIQMHIVETEFNNTTFVHIGTDYHAGWGLPAHAQKIVSERTGMVDVFEPGDRVVCELKRGTYQDEDGISSGGKWVIKTGTVESVYGQENTDGFVRFDDGDFQSISMKRGDDGYPGKNIQPATDETMPPNEILENTSYMDEPINASPHHVCAAPYSRGIGQGFGPTEDGEAE